MPRERIGIMGGSFNPIHQGHIAMAEAALKSASLHKILFIPSGNPPHKSITAVSSAQRYQMVACATAENKAFFPSRIEIDREGVIYSVDTLTLLRSEHEKADFFFIIGEDTLAELTGWCQYETVFSLCTFLVFRRPGGKPRPETYQDTLARMRALGASISEIAMPPLAISSTEIREQLAAGLLPAALPPALQAYIGLLGLYGYPAWYQNAAFIVDKLFLSLSPGVFAHSLCVCLCARELAALHGVDVTQATLAALLHDCGKCIPKQEMTALALKHDLTRDPSRLSSPALLHSLAGEYIAKVEYNIRDEAVLASIACHTQGREGMSGLDLVVYLADKIAPSREPYEGLEALRLLSKTDLKQAVIASMESTVRYLKAGEKPIHPAILMSLSFLRSNIN